MHILLEQIQAMLKDHGIDITKVPLEEIGKFQAQVVGFVTTGDALAHAVDVSLPIFTGEYPIAEELPTEKAS